MKQRTVNIIGAIYVTAAICVATFCPPPTFNWARVSEKPACAVDQETRGSDGHSGRLPGSTKLPRVSEYVGGEPVKHQIFAPTEEAKKEAIEKVAEEVKYPPNYVLIWTAEWCNKCPLMKAIGNKLTEEGFDVFTIDFDENQEKAKRDKIAGLPVAVIYTDNEEVKRVIGISPKSKNKQEKRIREVLEKNKKESNNYVVY